MTQGQLDLMLQHLPLEISFVDKDNIFRYYNDAGEGAAMIFPRTPGQVGRNIEYCHPPRVVDRVMSIVDALRSGEQDQEVMWFPMGDRFVYVTYHAVRDADGQFQGILETVQDIQPFRDLPTDRRR